MNSFAASVLFDNINDSSDERNVQLKLLFYTVVTCWQHFGKVNLHTLMAMFLLCFIKYSLVKCNLMVNITVMKVQNGLHSKHIKTGHE
jgi:hypothetical protein